LFFFALGFVALLFLSCIGIGGIGIVVLSRLSA
jgi:hypothetical protein